MSTEAILAVQQWGNSLRLRLPSAVAHEMGLHANQRVRITVRSVFSGAADPYQRSAPE